MFLFLIIKDSSLQHTPITIVIETKPSRLSSRRCKEFCFRSAHVTIYEANISCETLSVLFTMAQDTKCSTI